MSNSRRLVIMINFVMIENDNVEMGNFGYVLIDYYHFFELIYCILELRFDKNEAFYLSANVLNKQ
jgi:hypothetical protein